MKTSRRHIYGVAVALVVGVIGVAAMPQSASAATVPPAPRDLHEIMSKKECGTVPSSSFCDSVIRGGGIALGWKGDTSVPSWYKIYRVDGGRHDLVITVSTTWAGLSKSKGPFAARCYEVAATLGTLASRPSGRWCAGRDSTPTVKTFTPSQFSSLSTRRVGLERGDDACGLNIQGSKILSGLKSLFGPLFASNFSWLGPGIDTGNTALPWTQTVQSSVREVGALGSTFTIDSSTQAFSILQCGSLGSYHTTKNYASAYASIGVAFPLTGLSEHKVFSATLTLGIGPSTVIKSGKLARISGTSIRTSDFLCVREADPAMAPWWNAADIHLWGYRSQKASFALGPGVLVQADVTSIVQTWADDHDAGDNGFILRGTLDPTTAPGILPSPGLAACVTQYMTPKLVVVYF